MEVVISKVILNVLTYLLFSIRHVWLPKIEGKVTLSDESPGSCYSYLSDSFAMVAVKFDFSSNP